MNKHVIDKIATRYTVLNDSTFTIVDLVKSNDNVNKIIPKFVKNLDLGFRTIEYHNSIKISISDYEQLDKLCEEKKEITLMNFGNCLIKNKTCLIENIKGDPKTTSLKMLWINNDNKHVNVNIIDYYDFKENITSFIGEYGIKETKINEIVQFYKMDYYICKNIVDNVYTFIKIG